jgi:L-fuculose-phosphate aldolase
VIRYSAQRQQVAETALSLLETGLVVNTSGNASVRVDDDIIITPSTREYDSLQAEDICVIDLDGEMTDGRYLPSSETPLHLAIYNSRPDIHAIVHTHSVHATAVSTLVQELPAIHYQMVDLGGPVPVAPYETFGSHELAASVLGVLTERTAALMQNHGSITVADTLKKALARTIALEWCCEVWLKAVTANEPSTLDEAQMEAAKRQMESIARQRESMDESQN